MTSRPTSPSTITQTNQLIIPAWAANGGVAYCRWDGGPMEVAKAIESGWDYITNPQAVTAMHNWYGDRGFQLVRQAGFNWIWVTWSPGYSRRSEQWQHEILKPFIQRCQQDGIHITAYMSMCNLFAEDIKRHQSELLDCLQRDAQGKTIPYGAARYSGEPGRLLCCLNHPKWRQELKQRLTLAIEGGAEAAFYDNLAPWCQCQRCNERFRQYTLETLGRAVDIPSQKAAISPVLTEMSAEIDEQVDVVHWQVLHAYYAHLIDAIIIELTQHAETLKPDFMVYANWHVYYHSFGSASAKALSTEDGQLCCKLPDGQKTMSYCGFEVDGYLSNAGLLTRMLATAEGIRPVRMQSHQALSGSMENRDFKMYNGKQWQRLIAECWCYRAAQEVFVEGNFQTALYAGEPEAEEAWQAIAHYNHFHTKHRDTWVAADRSHVAFAVLVLDRYPQEGKDWQRVQWLTKLSLQGYQFDVVLNHQLNLDRLSRYPLLWIDSCECLSDDELLRIEQYLIHKGKVCITGRFAEQAAIGQPRDHSELQDWLKRLHAAGGLVVKHNMNVVPKIVQDAQNNYSVRVECNTSPILWKCWQDANRRLIVMVFNPDDTQHLSDVTIKVQNAESYAWFSPKNKDCKDDLPLDSPEPSGITVNRVETFGYVLATLRVL